MVSQKRESEQVTVAVASGVCTVDEFGALNKAEHFGWRLDEKGSEGSRVRLAANSM